MASKSYIAVFSANIMEYGPEFKFLWKIQILCRICEEVHYDYRFHKFPTSLGPEPSRFQRCGCDNVNFITGEL